MATALGRPFDAAKLLGLGADRLIDCEHHDNWVAVRREGIGGSDIPALLSDRLAKGGFPVWKSRYALWAEKAGKLEPEDLSGNDSVYWGKKHERAILEALAERSGNDVMAWPQTVMVRHAEHPFLRCTPDGIVIDPDRGPGLVQAKSTAEMNAELWTEGVPVPVMLQMQHELAVTGARWAVAAALAGNCRFFWHTVERDEGLIGKITAEAIAFWKSLESGEPPNVDGSESTKYALAGMWDFDNGDEVPLTDEFAAIDAELLELKDQEKQIGERRTALENKLKEAIGEASVGKLPSGAKYTWKWQDSKGYVVEARRSRVLRRSNGGSKSK